MSILSKRFVTLVLVGLIFSVPLYAYKIERTEQAENDKLKGAYWNKEFNANIVELLDWVFPDIVPEPELRRQPVAVPRQSKVSFQIALMSQKDSVCKISAGAISTSGAAVLESRVTVYKLLAVPVEANNNGGSKTCVGTEPPVAWQQYLTRKAPFEVYDVLVESDTVELRQGVFRPILVEVAVPKDAKPGSYKGGVRLVLGDKAVSSLEVPFEFVVHKTVAPEKPILNSTHWLWIDPENLTTEDIPDWWSQRHWDMIEQAGAKLAEYGQNTIFTPLIDGEQPLIQTTVKKDGGYEFDFSRFDRWFEVFLTLGFVNFDGHQIAGGHNARPMDVYAFDKSTGSKVKIFSKSDESAVEAWLEFLPGFYERLYANLKEKGWEKYYNQYQLDEPRGSDIANYEKLANMARKYMPGIRTKDAINSEPAKFSPLVDIQVFSITSLQKNKALAEQRMQQGKETWLYHCCSPYPPYPNRHLDEALTSSRLYPWYAYQLKANGYLYWAANNYRGADPYRTSVGPIPGGSQNPGHPPGDNWFFYRGPNGLRGSMRMTAFREGLLDHTLLMMLAEKDPARADEIMDSIARSLKDFERDPGPYYNARKMLLDSLDQM